jgi:ubiquinone/menaquinone biosynthesis C-methylase UbiE
VTRRSQAYVLDWIERHAAGRVFLDYGCGDGFNTRIAARAGASLSLGLDISDISIRNRRRQAEDEGLTGVRFFQADAEETGLPDASVDAVLCSGMLHHIDLACALPELRRILKPGGVALAVEALNYNPAIKLYRWLTPAMRTDREKRHILSLKDVQFASHHFDIADLRFWHVVGYAGGKFPATADLLDRVDQLLETVPYLNRLAWMFTFEMRKPR